MGNKKAAYAILERRIKSTGTSCISDNANVEINIKTAISNLEELKKSYTGNDMKGFYTDLCKALGLPVKTKINKGKKGGKKNNNKNKSDVSQYGRFFIGGKYISIRVSNHRTNADTYIKNGNYVYNLSVVVNKRHKAGGKSNDNVLLDEYAYFGKLLEDIENPMIKIIDGIIEYLKTGEYKDMVGIDGAKQISHEEEGLYNKLKEQYSDILKDTNKKEVFTYSIHDLSTDGEGCLNYETQKEYYDLKTAISAAKKELAKYKNVEDEIVVTIFGGEYEDENGNIEGEPRIFQQFSNKDKKFDSIINNSKNLMIMEKIKDAKKNVCDVILEGLLDEEVYYIKDTLDGVEPSILVEAVERVKDLNQGISLRIIWEEAMWVALERVFGDDFGEFSLGNENSYSVFAYESDLEGIENLDKKIAEFEDLTDFEISLY